MPMAPTYWDRREVIVWTAGGAVIASWLVACLAMGVLAMPMTWIPPALLYGSWVENNQQLWPRRRKVSR